MIAQKFVYTRDFPTERNTGLYSRTRNQARARAHSCIVRARVAERIAAGPDGTEPDITYSLQVSVLNRVGTRAPEI